MSAASSDTAADFVRLAIERLRRTGKGHAHLWPRRAVTALDETNLRIGKGDFIALVGPSGCGKSTILKLVGGLIPPSRGYVFVAGREVGAEPVRIGMAFQNPTLLPWLKMRDNVMLPLKIVPPFRQRIPRQEARASSATGSRRCWRRSASQGFGDKYPWQLSGGMMQRASLCRALIHDPQLLLLDEPFGALDQFTREELWAIMQELWITRPPDRDPRHPRSARGRLSRQPHLRDARRGPAASSTTAWCRSRGRAP